ncbi:putative transcription factor C2H2 family [Helianthus annuus]|uniref:Transcription factor C2H2 family n=1 Tax=Helianthus annuus TaxID=4232 RepID=A0A9K3DWN6_HELAN|nr:putative transcription factor C2H2 family [Helianthus annuus]
MKRLKRTFISQDKWSFSQSFCNKMSRCNNGYRSAYEPENGFIRFDGAYRIEKCWRKSGIQGRDVWRYLFVRCDNYPAAWTSDKYGDRPRPLPIELQRGTDVVERKGPPYWDYDCACNMCNKVMDLPLTTPCAHNFCKSCLLGCKDRNVMRCPS